MRTAAHLQITFVDLAKVPKPNGPRLPRGVKRAERAKWQINARLDAEGIDDTSSEDSDGNSATFDDSAE